ncbi:MAG TPA: ATP-binding protein, partial [Acidobacteriota bacterium]|nr:ATP-binding protein [Acidobacteriota bacterium]
MGEIHLLPDSVVNQIAAGEIIERPVSIVKEVVENALDAGATDVRVDIERGGKQLIRVSDNGKGMSEEDAVMAFERHATSKIQSSEDLHQIG